VVRLPEISPERRPFVPAPKPLWFLLSEDSKAALRKAQWINHRKTLSPPGSPADIMPFDAAAEMSKAPSSEDHMRG